jgi:hypothetical protein
MRNGRFVLSGGADPDTAPCRPLGWAGSGNLWPPWVLSRQQILLNSFNCLLYHSLQTMSTTETTGFEREMLTTPVEDERRDLEERRTPGDPRRRPRDALRPSGRFREGDDGGNQPPREGPPPPIGEEGPHSRQAYGRDLVRVTEPDLGSYTGTFGSPNVPVY